VFITILALIVVLGVLIFVHEAGHFIAAKWAGIYVHRFSLGLGSPIPWLTFKRGETEYSISWLPLGGYVKMASREEDVTSSALEGGHVEAPVPPDRVFEAKPVWKRMVVILAGVTMNALFAWLAFTFLAAKNGRLIDPTTTVGQVIDEMVPPGGEALRDIPAGAKITAINGRPVKSWNDVTEGIANAPESELRLTLDDGRTVTLPIHQDALEERLKATQALQPFRPAVIGQVIPGRPAARAGIEAGDTIVRIGDRAIAQWYDVLEVLQATTGTPIAMASRKLPIRMAMVTGTTAGASEGASTLRPSMALSTEIAGVIAPSP
jgi:regulator of sigma E protease